MSKLRVVTIGGGGGHAQVLKALKTLDNVVVTAICPSTDSGGSTGVLQQEYAASGYLGDLTKCFAALCPNETLAKTLLFRYQQGCLYGHSVKNILFLALERVAGLPAALDLMASLCGLGDNRVIPVTFERTELCATLRVGNKIIGETLIDKLAKNPLWHPEYHKIQDVYLSPNVGASEVACSALAAADWCVICPGDLYSSILPVLLPDGMKTAMVQPRVIVVLNIMTKRGETDNYRAMDFVAEIENRIGGPCDVILVNDAPLPEKLILEYALEQKVQVDPKASLSDPRVRTAPLVKVTEEGFLYHDPEALAREFAEVFAQQMTF